MTVKKLVKSTHPILNKTIQPVSTYDQKTKSVIGRFGRYIIS